MQPGIQRQFNSEPSQLYERNNQNSFSNHDFRSTALIKTNRGVQVQNALYNPTQEVKQRLAYLGSRSTTYQNYNKPSGSTPYFFNKNRFYNNFSTVRQTPIYRRNLDDLDNTLTATNLSDTTTTINYQTITDTINVTNGMLNPTGADQTQVILENIKKEEQETTEQINLTEN